LNSNRRAKIIIKTMAMIVAGILTSIAFLANIGTYSWFAGTARNSVNVSAAETEDIIECIEVIYKDMDPDTGEEYNPIAIKLKKSQSFSPDPLIFFSVEGEAAEYILHINPVRLYSNAYYIIPIETDINVDQHAKLYNRTDRIEGTLRVKYMNEFIDISKDIRFSKDFLINRLMSAIIRGDVQEEKPQSSVVVMRFATLVEAPEDTADMQKSRSTDYRTAENAAAKAIVSLAQLIDWKGIDIVSEDRGVSDEALLFAELQINYDQEYLMDIIYPGLKRHMEELKGCIGRLRAEIKDKNAQLADLDEKLLNLESQYDKLLEENARLTERIGAMALSTPPAPPIHNPGTVPTPTEGGEGPEGDSGATDENTSGNSQNEDQKDTPEEPATEEISHEEGTDDTGDPAKETAAEETPDKGEIDPEGETGPGINEDGNNNDSNGAGTGPMEDVESVVSE